jgi:DNA-binding MarR family transcriptional regulator
MTKRPGQKSVNLAIEQLRRLSELFRRRRMQIAKQVGLTEQALRVLEEVAADTFYPALYARVRESSRASVSGLIEQLTEKRLISYTIHPQNRRRRAYRLTAAGERKMARLRELRGGAIDKIWMEIAPAKLAVFSDVSQHLIDSLEQYVMDQEE